MLYNNKQINIVDMLASVFQRTSSPVKHVGYGTGVRGTFRPT